MQTWLQVALAQLWSVGFLLVLLASAAGFYGAFRRLDSDPADRGLLAAIALVAGPLSMAFVASLLFRYLPATLPFRGYVVLPLVIAVAGVWALALGAQRWLGACEPAETLPAQASREGILLKVILIAAAAATALALVTATALAVMAPVFGNDSLEYAAAGRIIAQARSMADYPFLDGAKTGGLVTPWTHPPAQISLIAMAFMFQGGDLMHAEALKLIAPYFAVAQAALLVAFAGRGGLRAAGFVAAVLVLAAPVYFRTIVQSHVDPMRLAAFTASVAATWILLRRPNPSSALICGLACGCAGFTHSIGMLTMVLVLPAYFILDRSSFGVRLRNCVIVGVIGTAFVAPTLLTNITVFGNPIQDAAPAWALPHLQFNTNLSIERALETPAQQVFFGLMRGFTEPETFAYVFWVLAFGLVGVIWYSAQKQRAPIITHTGDVDPAVLCVLIIAGFVAILGISVLAGSSTAIKNGRYMLTVAPLAAIAAARLLAAPLARKARS